MKVSDPTLDVKASLGSYERISIDIKDTTSEMRPPTMMGDSSCIVLGVACLCGINDSECT